MTGSRRHTLHVVAGGLGGALLVACGAASPAGEPETPATGRPTGAPGGARPAVASLRLAIAGDEGTLQPYTYKTGYPGWNLLSLLYDTLLQLDSENVPRPLLARDVSVSAGGTTYEIALRPGVTWHDGKPLTADDVKFTVEYFLRNVHSRFTNPLRTVDSVTVRGAEGLTIALKAPNPSFPIRALADVPILPRHVWETVEGERTKEVEAKIGSGPYRLVEADPEAVYRLQAHAGYFLGPPPANELIFPVIKDLNTALQALRAGEVQAVVRALPPEHVPQFSQPPFKVAKGPGFVSTLLQLNTERPPFTRKDVRQAIDLAIDKKKLVDTVLLGTGTVATPGFVHPSSPFHDQTVAARFDPSRARQLLDQAGARPGADGVRVLDGKPFAFTLLVQANNPLRIRAAELIASMLKDVGLRVTVRALDSSAVDDLVWKGYDVTKPRDYDLAMWGWTAPLQVDPARIVELVHSDPRIGTTNVGAYRSAEADAVGEGLRTTVDEAKRRPLAQAVERTIAADVPFVMLYFEDGNYVYRAQAFDGWVYQKGQGIYTKLSFLPAFGR
jgi:peptide/nickel transport system substrate-binding protein